jgi:hypothetical protein
MLRVYLDMNHWVALTKARVGHKDGSRFEQALILLHEAVDRGWVSVPLSMYHAMELQHRDDWKSRLDVAGTMVQLSQWHAIAPQHKLVGPEIDRALRATFGVPAVPRATQTFGVGIDHVMGREISNFDLRIDLEVPPELEQSLQRLGQAAKEALLLTGPAPGMKMSREHLEVSRELARQFGRDQDRVRSDRETQGQHKGAAGRRWSTYDAFGDFRPQFDEALRLAGLTGHHLIALGEKGLDRLVRDIPIAFTQRELHRLRHEASQKQWEENDLIDLIAISTAIVHCDVVVTERQWTAFVERTKLGEQSKTIVLRDLKSLEPLLIKAASG